MDEYTINRHNELFQKASETLYPYMQLEGCEHQEITDADRDRITEAINTLEEVLTINPQNWAALWIIGKTYQALGDHQSAYACFWQAHQIDLQQPDVLRELALQCLVLKIFEDACYYAQSAIQFNHSDPTLWANYAVALMMKGDTTKAAHWADKTLRHDANDLVAKNTMRVLQEIQEGKRGIPQDFSELQEEPDLNAKVIEAYSKEPDIKQNASEIEAVIEKCSEICNKIETLQTPNPVV